MQVQGLIQVSKLFGKDFVNLICVNQQLHVIMKDITKDIREIKSDRWWESSVVVSAVVKRSIFCLSSLRHFFIITLSVFSVSKHIKLTNSQDQRSSRSNTACNGFPLDFYTSNFCLFKHFALPYVIDTHIEYCISSTVYWNVNSQLCWHIHNISITLSKSNSCTIIISELHLRFDVTDDEIWCDTNCLLLLLYFTWKI